MVARADAAAEVDVAAICVAVVDAVAVVLLAVAARVVLDEEAVASRTKEKIIVGTCYFYFF